MPLMVSCPKTNRVDIFEQQERQETETDDRKSPNIPVESHILFSDVTKGPTFLPQHHTAKQLLP